MNTTETTGITGSSNQHARLSPSDSKRWGSCTASIAFQEANAHRVRKDNGGVFADWGTTAHEHSAQVLLGQVTLDMVPEEYAEVVGLYTSHCLSRVERAKLTSIKACREELKLSQLLGVEHEPHDRVYFVEEELSLFYQPEQTGTADFIGLIAKGGVVERFIGLDLKAGAGVLYTSHQNTQLAIYMYSAIKLLEGVYEFGPETQIELAIFQPRHREGAAQSPWIITLADLTTFCEDIEYRAIQARTGAERVREKIGAPGRDVSPEEILEAAPMVKFHAEDGDGGSCRWCKCKAFCPKRLSTALDGLDTPHITAEDMLAAIPDLDKVEKKLPLEERVSLMSERLGLSSLGDDYLVKLYHRSKAITKFLDDVEEYLTGRMYDGEQIDGVKLVEGREGNRAWVNEDAADLYLKQKLKMEERYSMKLKSPTQIEVLLGEKLNSTRSKNTFNSLIARSSAKRVIALADDKRPAVGSLLAALPDVEDDDPCFE